jgi:hypothetical protein
MTTLSLNDDRAYPEFSIKLYAWEHAFLRRVLFVRNEEELKMLRKIGICTVSIYQLMQLLPFTPVSRIQAFNTALWTGIPRKSLF